MAEEYNSVSDRQKGSQSRVYIDLTTVARERIAHITLNPTNSDQEEIIDVSGIPDKVINRAINQTYTKVGYSKIRDEVNIRTLDSVGIHREICEKCDTLVVLTYIEQLLLQCVKDARNISEWKQTSIPRSNVPTAVTMENKERFESWVTNELISCVRQINIVLQTEGILWELEFDKDNLDFNFYPIGSELMSDSDDSFCSVASGKRWKSVASPYNDAFELYKDRTYSREIPEKLYNSIEELCRVICVDLNSWADNRELNLGNYLSIMDEHELFDPNSIMRAEVNDLANGMEKAFQKVGDERHNRHHEIDREYCTLMLHQISAYLTYIIRKYDEYESK